MLRGSFEYYPYNGYGLFCAWRAIQNESQNSSDITLDVYLRYRTVNLLSGTISLSVNGSTVQAAVPAINENSEGIKTLLLKRSTFTVNHQSDGTSGNVSLSAALTGTGTVNGDSVAVTASDIIVLDPIDRDPPIITVSVDQVTATAMVLNVKTSTAVTNVEYSTDGGRTWEGSTGRGASAAMEFSYTLDSLAPGSFYEIVVKADRLSNGVTGYSDTLAAHTKNAADITSVQSLSIDSGAPLLRIGIECRNALYAYTLELKDGATTVLSIGDLSISAGTAVRNIVLTTNQKNTVLNYMSAMRSFECSYVLKAYNRDDEQQGPASYYTGLVYTTEEDSAPAIKSFTCTDTDTSTQTIIGDNTCFVQHCSRLLVSPGLVSANNGASIARYVAVVGDKTVDSVDGTGLDLGVLSQSGTVDVTLFVTDTRGYTTSSTAKILVHPYSMPQLFTSSAARNARVSEYIDLAFEGAVASIEIDREEKNTLTLARVRVKETGMRSYGEFTDITSAVRITDNLFEYSDTPLVLLHPGKSFDVNLQLQDRFHDAVDFYFVVPQQQPLVSFRNGMVGINTNDPQSALHVEGAVTVTGNVKATSFSGSVSPSNLSSAVTIAKGGTGATLAANARSNLGIKGTSVYSGTLTTGTTSFSYSTYKAFAILGTVDATSVLCGILVPKIAITTAGKTFAITNGTNTQEFSLKYSGSTVTLAFGTGNGAIKEIYGIN